MFLPLLPQAIKGNQKSSSSPPSSLLLNLSIISFWKLVSALKEFTFNEGGGFLPVRGDLPDMTAGSDRYLKLLQVYREGADWAVEQLASRLSHVSLDSYLFVQHILKLSI